MFSFQMKSIVTYLNIRNAASQPDIMVYQRNIMWRLVIFMKLNLMGLKWDSMIYRDSFFYNLCSVFLFPKNNSIKIMEQVDG